MSCLIIYLSVFLYGLANCNIFITNVIFDQMRSDLESQYQSKLDLLRQREADLDQVCLIKTRFKHMCMSKFIFHLKTIRTFFVYGLFI